MGLPSTANEGNVTLVNREPIIINNDHAYNEAFKMHEKKCIKDSGTYKGSLSLSMGSTLAIQCENGGPWTHRVIEKVNISDHNGKSCIACHKLAD